MTTNQGGRNNAGSKFFHTRVDAIKTNGKQESLVQVKQLQDQVYESIKVMANKMDDDFNQTKQRLDIIRRDLIQSDERARYLEESLDTTRKRMQDALIIGVVVFVASLVAVVFWR